MKNAAKYQRAENAEIGCLLNSALAVGNLAEDTGLGSIQPKQVSEQMMKQ